MKFCGECAASLAATCPSCGAANPPENKFCGQCAAPLRTTRTAKFTAPDAYTPKHLAEKILTSKAVLGRLDEAQTLGERVLERSPSRHGVVANALHLLGDIATHPDRFDAESGAARYRQALALAEPRGMRPLVAHCHLGLGKLYRRTGQRERAHEHLTTATTMYREMGMTYWLEQAAMELTTPTQERKDA
jgi:tetratricopeptide (TPR) repeat protein